jgi:M6 family metalloprotease-like protein
MRALPALALAAALAACAEPAATTDTAEQTAIMQPHWKFGVEYTEFLERFGFQKSLVTAGYFPYTKEIPLPKDMPLLVIVAERGAAVDGRCPGKVARTDAEIWDLVFSGGFPSARNYFRDNSHDRLRLVEEGIVHVCGLPVEVFSDATKLIEAAVTAASVQHDLGRYDVVVDGDGDGQVRGEELTILVLDDSTGADWGQAVEWSSLPFAQGGYFRGWIAAAGGGASLFTWLHELGHTLGADDLYGNGANHRTSLYGAAPTLTGTIHLDAWHKLRLGWLRPDVVDLRNERTGSRFLHCDDTELAELEGSILFHDPDRGTDQYFLAEARCDRGYDAETNRAGVAIWQVVQSPTVPFAPMIDRVYQKDGKGCTAMPGGGFVCKTPSVCLHGLRKDGEDVCRNSKFLVETLPTLRGLPLRWEDGSAAGIEVKVWPKIEYIDHGIPGHHHDPHIVGYEVSWEPTP